ncbi:MAG: type III pantothenate kinase [Eubacteriales bacterium]|nr:type III pantothenate kinase [Eubacteriales bacterium]
MLIAMIADNSHIRVKGFEGDEQTMLAAIATEPRQTADHYICLLGQLFAIRGVQKDQITGCVLGSVVPQLTQALCDALTFVTGQRVLNVSSGIRTGLNIRSAQPQQVGADRVAAAVAAKARDRLPCVVVDCGAATTFTVLDRSGILCASAIAAGVQMSLEALHASSAQLPTVALEAAGRCDVLARSTEDAMRVGVTIGAAAMIDGMLARYAEALGATPQVWLTGGSASFVAPHLRARWHGADDLAFEGLRLIWEKNHPER